MQEEEKIQGDHVQHPKIMLKLPEVIRRTGLSRSSIYAEIKKNKFPKQVRLMDRAVAWVEAEIDAWNDTRAACRT